MQQEEAQKILEAAQAKQLAAEAKELEAAKVLDELHVAKAQVKELQEREKILGPKDSESFSASSVQPDTLLQHVKKLPSQSHGAPTSRTSGSVMSYTRESVDATKLAGGAHALRRRGAGGIRGAQRLQRPAGAGQARAQRGASPCPNPH